MKRCAHCHEQKPLSEFHRNARAADGVQSRCKPCHIASVGASAKKNPQGRRAINKAYRTRHPERHKASTMKWRGKDEQRARELDAEKARRWRARNPEVVREIVVHRRRARQAAPEWGDKGKIRLVYKKAREFGFEVDHIVPLKHPLVCGLHVWANLQLLERTLNRSKNNRTWPDSQ